MDNGKLKTLLTWAGIAALVAIPVVVLLKKRKEEPAEGMMDDDSNIFAAELEE
jgi:LPXTG-motif cell wall-anchored protein